MEVYKVTLTSWTASFRYPNIISGIQPTLEVPPLSTVLGLINAAAGRYLQHQQLKIGYFFCYGSKGEDLETIYQFKGIKDSKTKFFKKNQSGDFMVSNKNVTSNIILRQFLFDNHLSIYLQDDELIGFFKTPFYQLVLGRSNDLATVESIQKVKLTKSPQATKIRGQIIPFKNHFLPGQIQALPQYFTDSIPRKNLGTQAYSIINYESPVSSSSVEAFYDETNKVDVFFHDLKF